MIIFYNLNINTSIKLNARF